MARKRNRLDRHYKYYAEPPKRGRLKTVARKLFVDIPTIYSGYIFTNLGRQMQSWTPEAQQKFAGLVSDYNRIVKQRLDEGWTAKRSFWRGDVFQKGNLMLIRDDYNVHVHYLGMKLYEKKFNHRIDALDDFNRIFGNDRLLAQFDERGRRWVLP